jgi:glycosyltransferase involved in cell wall biosynthesis
MKIVQFEDFFHPQAGYNINIFSKYMAKMGHEVVILTSDIDKSPRYLKSFFDCSDIDNKDREFELTNGVKIERLKTHFFYSGRSIVSLRIFNRIQSYSPDIIYIHGTDTYVGILSTLLNQFIKTPLIFDSSMVEMASTNKFNWLFRSFYRFFVAPVFRRHQFKVVRTQDDDYVSKHLGIPLSLAPFISLGVDTDKFKPSKKPVELLERLNLKTDDFVVVYAGKVDISKGAELLISTLTDKTKFRRNIVFLIIGTVNTEVKVKFDNALKESSNRIITIPTITYSELSDYYQVSDLAIFPRQISLSFFNAQACGLPVIAESNNINNERLSHGNGYTFEYGNFKDLVMKINQVVDLQDFEYNEMSRNAITYIQSGYDFNSLIHSYLGLIESEIAAFQLR